MVNHQVALWFEALELSKKEHTLKEFGLKIKEFDRYYKRLNNEEQGEYHWKLALTLKGV